MKRATSIQQELVETHMVQELTEVFESIASIKIAKIRGRVVASKAFFAELWQIYGGLRIDPKQRLARPHIAETNKDVLVIVTAEGKLSGDIDEHIIKTMLGVRKDPETSDIVVIGSHGLSLLQQMNVQPANAFHLPESDANFNVANIVADLNKYKKISVFYQTYESLRLQKVAQIELLSAVKDLSEDVEEGEIVSSHEYIFEPSIDEIADYMESVMMGVALIQVIMETKLAQHASRFNAMNSAKHRAGDLYADFRRSFYRAKRGEADERLKEIMNVARTFKGATVE
jgi:F-type H+-transporting ATPase subunit gamma